MRTKSIMLLVLALGCGLIAAIGVTQVISQNGDENPSNEDMVNILVANEDIPARVKLTPQNVRVEAWPKSKIPKGTLVDIAQLDGMRARSEILVDEAIREQKLFGKGDINTAAQHIDPTMRAVPIKIEQDSNAGLIKPGDRVDVLVNLRKNKQEGIMSSRTKMLLQNVEVFAVDDLYEINPDSKEKGQTVTARTVSLFLTPKQAVKVDLAQTYGKMRLVLRNPNDNSVVEGDTDISLEELLDPSAKRTDKQQAEVKPIQNPVPKPVVQYRPETWKMRILAGAGINDLVLEERNGNNGKKIWHVTQEGEEPASAPASSVSTPATSMIDNSLVPPNLEPSGE